MPGVQVGDIVLWLAMGAALGSLGLYLASIRKAALIRAARLLYVFSGVCVFTSSIILLTYMLTNRFDIKYVHDYSSINQALIYKISGFWGGQEGSWLLWLTWICIGGLLLYRRAAAAEPQVMAFWSSVQVFFLTILVVRSPFLPVDSAMADPEGLGLNPLLQNYWMAIHPPILFAGFTLISIPAAFAVAALIRKDHANWTRLVFGWAVAGWTILGIGLLLGGIWAYETLGWGGFWGWDPVENASLVPWLLGGALIHGLMLERTKGSWRKLNIFMAYAVFITVIYATYLTRSGILGDFSVHSFASLDSSKWLLGFLLAYIVFGFGLVALRSGKVDEASGFETISSKEFLVFIGIVMFSMAGVLVAVGMSAPIYTKWLSGEPGAVPIEYYYNVTTPLLLVMMALVGCSPLVGWARARKSENRSNTAWIRLLMLSMALGLIAGAIYWQKSGAEIGARVAVGWFAFTILVPNLYSLWDTIRRTGWRLSGGHIAHVGLSVFLLGMLAATHNNKEHPDRIALEIEKPREFQGYTWTFMGSQKNGGDGKEKMLIAVEPPTGISFLAQPIIQEVRQGQMLHPFIRRSITGDLYIAPVTTEFANLPPHGTLAKGHSADIGPYHIEFLDFDKMEMFEDGTVQAGTKLKVTHKETGTTETLTPIMAMGEGEVEFTPATFKETEHLIVVTNMSVTEQAATIAIDGPEYRAAIVHQGIIEVTFKPLVWLQWLGAAIIAVGGGISSMRRSREARQVAESAKPEQNSQDTQASSGETPPVEDKEPALV